MITKDVRLNQRVVHVHISEQEFARLIRDAALKEAGVQSNETFDKYASIKVDIDIIQRTQGSPAYNIAEWVANVKLTFDYEVAT